MTNPEFAELKEKLCRKQYVDIYVQREHDTAIIRELVEIIQSQSEALEESSEQLYDVFYDDHNINKCKLQSIKNDELMDQTNTRLQKLREGNK